jgi:hypothetical protein
MRCVTDVLPEYCASFRTTGGVWRVAHRLSAAAVLMLVLVLMLMVLFLDASVLSLSRPLTAVNPRPASLALVRALHFTVDAGTPCRGAERPATARPRG